MNRRLDPKDIPQLQEHAENIRNICILAHVDHGKTTLSDSLVCANGFISAKLAGKLRFMDSMEEEQQRGITMHTSAISLLYQMDEKFVAPSADKSGPPPNTNYLINLVDSPGHIDFSSDVSTATRLCDGALVLIDVLEGICTQTHAVLYKALKERMRPCLVLNKIDRLCLELQLSPMEAYNHLRRIVEGTNALAATLIHAEFGEDYFSNASETETAAGTEKSDAQRIQEEWTFSPERGNVLFASAYDCWGTNVMKFVNIWAKKWAGGINKGALLKYIFDDYCYNPKTKKLVKYSPSDSLDPENAWKKPLFVVMILEPIFHVYSSCMIDKNTDEAVRYLQEEFGVAIIPRDINPRDVRLTTQNMLRKWVPLTEAVFRMVVKCVPSPVEAQTRRIDVLMVPQDEGSSPLCNEKSEALVKMRRITADIAHCASISLNNTAISPEVVVFIAKMIPIKVAELSSRDKLLMFPECADGSAPQASEVLMGIGRVFSGVLTRSSRLSILSHRHSPLDASTHHDSGDSSLGEAGSMGTLTSIPVDTLGFYICLGPSVFPTDSVPAGNIVGIVGLQHNSQGQNGATERSNLMVSKSATISSTPMLFPLKAMTFQSKPMVRVAVAPKTHNEMTQFEFGLRQLYAYDPVVEIEVDATTGQHTITCLGELHLEQCVKSLSERFAKCEVVVSAPIVPFRETITCLQNDVEREAETAMAVSAPENSGKGAGKNKHGAARTAAPVAIYDPRTHLPPPWSTIPELLHSTAVATPAAETDNSDQDVSAAAAVVPPAMLNGKYKKNFSVVLVQSAEGGTRPLTLHMTMRCAIIPRDCLAVFDEHHKALQEALQQFRLLHATQAAEGESETAKYTDFLLELPAESRAVLLALYAVLCPTNVNGSNNDVAAANSKLILVLTQLVALGPSSAASNAMMFDSQFTFQITSSSQADSRTEYNHHPFISRHARAAPNSKAGLVHAMWTVLFQERLQHPLIVGFHSACGSGPLMQEPVHGVTWVLERVSCSGDCFTEGAPAATACFEEWLFAHEFAPRQVDSTSESSSVYADDIAVPARQSSPIPSEDACAGGGAIGELPAWTDELIPCALQSGMMISEIREMCRCLLLGHPMRVFEPVYKCEIQCDASVLSALYGVLGKRRSNIVDENIIEGTSLFLITVHLPVIESFGFALELLKRTSGKGTNTAGSGAGGAGTGATGNGGIQAPQLSYSHWQILPQDPFWKPTTAEELEEFGEMASAQQHSTTMGDSSSFTGGSDASGSSANVTVSNIISRRIIDSVRVRKGLPIEVKTVANADKQRTISKNK